MKHLINLLMVAAFLVATTMAFAAEPGQPGMPGKAGVAPEPGKTVNCCVNKECKKVGSEADCAKIGGKVVKDCKDCK